MHIDTKLSSDSSADQGYHLSEFDYVNEIGGFALILTAIVFLMACFSCFWKKYTVVGNKDENQLKDTMKTMNPSVRYSPNSRTNPIQISLRGTFDPSNTAAFPKPRGLTNNRNTCYFNSVMQALAQTTILQKELNEVRDHGDMIRELIQFCASMHSSETSKISPRRLQHLMFQKTGKFVFGVQHDSHECLLNILHELRKDERKGGGELLTVVDKIFGGHTMTVYTCEVCHTPSHLCEPFLDISLPIPKGRKSSAKRARTGVQEERNRPLPPFDGVKHGMPQQQEVNIHHTTWSNVDFESKEGEHRGRKKKTQADDRSRESSTGCEFKKRDDDDDGSRIKTSELTARSELAASNGQDATVVEQDAYKEAVRCMMTTLSKSRESTDQCNPTLDDCLRCYTRKERIVGEYLCRECDSQSETETDMRLTSASKQTLIFNPPAVLMFHLKRFENKSKVYVKRNTIVRYKEVLDIGPYYTGWGNDEQSQNVWYSLYAVVVHSGTLQSGHYIAYVKVREFDQTITQFLQKSYLNRDDITVESLIDRMHNRIPREYPPTSVANASVACKEGTWYCVNDRTVTEVSVQEAINQEAFLLFYERL